MILSQKKHELNEKETFNGKEKTIGRILCNFAVENNERQHDEWLPTQRLDYVTEDL